MVRDSILESDSAVMDGARLVDLLASIHHQLNVLNPKHHAIRTAPQHPQGHFQGHWSALAQGDKYLNGVYTSKASNLTPPFTSIVPSLYGQQARGKDGLGFVIGSWIIQVQLRTHIVTI